MNDFFSYFPYLLSLFAICLTFLGLIAGFVIALHTFTQIPAIKSNEARLTSFFIGLNSIEPAIGLGISFWWIATHFIDVINLHFPFPYPSVLLGLFLATVPLLGLSFRNSTYMGLSLAQSAMILSRWLLNAIFVWLSFNSQYRDAILVLITFGPIWLIINLSIAYNQIKALRTAYITEAAEPPSTALSHA